MTFRPGNQYTQFCLCQLMFSETPNRSLVFCLLFLKKAVSLDVYYVISIMNEVFCYMHYQDTLTANILLFLMKYTRNLSANIYVFTILKHHIFRFVHLWYCNNYCDTIVYYLTVKCSAFQKRSWKQTEYLFSWNATGFFAIMLVFPVSKIVPYWSSICMTFPLPQVILTKLLVMSFWYSHFSVSVVQIHEKTPNITITQEFTSIAQNLNSVLIRFYDFYCDHSMKTV